MGIEPTAQAWEAWVLPLYDARYALDSSRVPRGRQIMGRDDWAVLGGRPGDTVLQMFHFTATPCRHFVVIVSLNGL